MRLNEKRPRRAGDPGAARYWNQHNPNADWLRVNRERRCPVCGKPDWCLIAADGAAALCQRVASSKRCGGGGWLHRLRDTGWRPTRTRQVHVRPTLDAGRHINFVTLARKYARAVDSDDLRKFAASLGVNVVALWRLGIGWDGSAWTFPMRDSDMTIVGIRRRLPSGKKLSVRGSRQGLFIPVGVAEADQILVAEGESDCAALTTLGFNVVGRPSCVGGVRYLCQFLRGRSVVVVSDGDEPGRRGAMSLASVLRVYCRTVCVIQPPNNLKDARQWLQAGATRSNVEHVIETGSIHRLRVTSRRIG